jgi:hypothetical protein
MGDLNFNYFIAIARQIFQNKVFFSLPGEVFLVKRKKNTLNLLIVIFIKTFFPFFSKENFPRSEKKFL